MATVPHIIDVYPAPGSTGIAIGDSITVEFDQEMDENSINSGTFVLIAPDTGVVFGAELNPFEEPGLDDQDILSSPYYGGFVKATISFSRVNASGGVVSDSEVDYDGEGDLWRTVAILTPSQPLSPNKQYSVLVAGDEDPTNQFDSGVRTRTVFDAEPVTVTGTGDLEFTGGYTGTVEKTYVLEITTIGATGTATYQWWDSVDPLTVFDGTTTTGLRELTNGLCVSFDPDGTFALGDRWQVVCVPFESLANTYRWSFYTGSGAVVTPTSTYSASGISELGASLAPDTFEVIDITPVGRKYGVAISEDPYVGESITIEFTTGDVIDETTLTNAISVRAEPANGDTLTISYTGDLDFTSSVSGNELTILLDPGQLYENNIVIITLDKDIANTDGTTLGTEYVSYFSTTYTPLYSGIRRIQLDLGPLATDIPEESIMLAILEASLYAQAITFSTTTYQQTFFYHARREFTTCMAEKQLVGALLSDGLALNKMYKKLGDLSVSRDGLKGQLRDNFKRLENCVNYWKIAVETGGEISPDASIKPGYSVKGDWAVDAITVSRQWEPMTAIGGNGIPAANTRVARTSDSSERRQYRTFRTRSWRSDD